MGQVPASLKQEKVRLIQRFYGGAWSDKVKRRSRDPREGMEAGGGAGGVLQVPSPSPLHLRPSHSLPGPRNILENLLSHPTAGR